MNFFKGFMDHTTPIKEELSKFWKSNFEEVKNMFDRLLDEIDFNNFTLYTKWYTNGIKSDLHFLINSIEATMIKTDNQFLRDIISYLHGKGISVGIMLQVYTYEKKGWGEVSSWGKAEVEDSAGVECVVVDPTSSLFQKRLSELIREQITLFPDVDYLFIEGEFCSGSVGFSKYLKENCSTLTYSNEIKKYCSCLGIQIREDWSEESRELLGDINRKTLHTVRKVLSDNRFKGRYGWVYHIYGIESHIVRQTIDDKNCILVPWVYFGWEDKESKYYRTRVEASQQHLANMHKKGYSVIYLGDVTIGHNRDYDIIREMYDYCYKLGLCGYLGMGTPDPMFSLRWEKVTDEMIECVRQVYKGLYGVGKIRRE